MSCFYPAGTVSAHADTSLIEHVLSVLGIVCLKELNLFLSCCDCAKLRCVYGFALEEIG